MPCSALAPGGERGANGGQSLSNGRIVNGRDKVSLISHVDREDAAFSESGVNEERST